MLVMTRDGRTLRLQGDHVTLRILKEMVSVLPWLKIEMKTLDGAPAYVALGDIEFPEAPYSHPTA